MQQIFKLALLFIIFYTPFICARVNSWVISLTVGLIFIIFFVLLVSKKSIFTGFPKLLNLSVCLFILVVILSTIFSQNIYLSAIELIKILAGIILCYLVASCFSMSKREVAIRVILIGALLIVLYGFYQYFIGFSDTMKYLGTDGLNIPSDELIEIKKNLLSKRIFSTFLYPNSYAGYLIMILPLALELLILSSGKMKFLLLVFNLGLILSVVLTKSIGGLITVLFSLAVIFYLLFIRKIKQPRRFSTLLHGVIILVAVLFILLLFLRTDSIFDFNSPNNSIASRINYWKGCFNIIKEYPIIGSGLGTFGMLYPKFKLKDAGDTIYCHNLYLQFASEVGLVGLASILFLFFVIFKNLIKNCPSPGLISSVFGFLLHNIIDFDFYMLELNLIFWFLVGLGISNSSVESIEANSKRKDQPATKNQSYITGFLTIGAILNLFITVFFNAGKGTIPVNVSIFITLVLFSYLLIRGGGITIYKFPINTPVFLFLIILIFSAILSQNKHSTSYEISKILNFGIVIYMIGSYIKNTKEIKKIIYSIITISFLLALYALLKGIFKDNLVARLYGNFPNPNLLAGFLVAPLILIINILIYNKNKSGKIFFVVSGIVILITFILTGSRGAFLSFFAGLIASILIYLFKEHMSVNRIGLGVSLLVIFLIVFLVLSNPMKERIISADKIDKLAYKRIEIWKSTLMMIKDNPIVGSGLGTYEDVYNKYVFPVEGSVARFGRYASFAHNEYLQIASELGIFALLTFLWFIFSILKLQPSTIPSADKNGISIGVYCGIVSVLTHSIVDFNLHLISIFLLLAVLIGLHLSLSKKYDVIKINKRYNLYFFAGLIILFILLITTISGFIFSRAAEKYRKENNIEKALKNYNIAISLDSMSSDYYNSIGSIYEFVYTKTRNYKMLLYAEENYLKACKFNKVNGYYRKHLGFLYLIGFDKTNNVELLKKAVHSYNEAILLNPYNPFFVSELGIVHAKLGDFNSAKKYFIKAVELEPNYILGHHNLAVVAEKLKDFNLSKYEHNKVNELIKSKLKPVSDYEKSLLEIGDGFIFEAQK